MAIETIAQRSKELQTVSKRNRFIEGVRKTRELYRQRRKIPTIILKMVTRVAVAKTKLVGHENLHIASRKIAEGEQLTGAACHTADSDHPVLENSLETDGFQDLARRFVFPAGLKMWDRAETEWGMWGMNTLPVAAPGYFDDARKLLQSDLSADQRQQIELYLSNMRWLNRESMRVLVPRWRKGEVVPIVYPETTRSRDGYIQRGRVETDIYFQKGWILPLLIEGVGEVFPPEGKPNLGKILRREFRPKITAGELISGEVLHAPQTLDWLRERRATPVDFIMSRVVSPNPERANPVLRALYKSLAENIPEGLILRAA